MLDSHSQSDVSSLELVKSNTRLLDTADVVGVTWTSLCCDRGVEDCSTSDDFTAQEQVLDGGCTDVEKALYLIVLTSPALELFSILLSSLAMKSVSSRNRRYYQLGIECICYNCTCMWLQTACNHIIITSL